MVGEIAFDDRLQALPGGRRPAHPGDHILHKNAVVEAHHGIEDLVLALEVIGEDARRHAGLLADARGGEALKPFAQENTMRGLDELGAADFVDSLWHGASLYYNIGNCTIV